MNGDQTELLGRDASLVETRAAEETEWTGLPAFHPAPKRELRLVVTFEKPEARDELVARLGLVIAKKTGPTWSAWYPPREREDLAALRFDLGDGESMPEITDEEAAEEVAAMIADAAECDGSATCPADVHIEGCYRSRWRVEDPPDGYQERIIRAEDEMAEEELAASRRAEPTPEEPAAPEEPDTAAVDTAGGVIVYTDHPAANLRFYAHAECDNGTRVEMPDGHLTSGKPTVWRVPLDGMDAPEDGETRECPECARVLPVEAYRPETPTEDVR